MKRRRRNDVTAELVVGAFVFLVLFVLAFFTIIIGKQSLFRKTYPMTVYFSDVQGLRDGESVLLRGMKIGVVEELSLDADSGKVGVTFHLNEPLELYTDYTVEILTSSLLGGKQVVIHEGTHSAGTLAADVRLEGSPPADLLVEATEVVREIRESFTQGGILDNLEETMANLKTITAKANEGEGTLARLLNEDDIYAELQSAFTNFNAVAVDLKSISERLAKGEGSIGKLLSDDTSLYDKIDDVVENLRSMSDNLAKAGDRLENGEGTLGRLFGKNEEIYDNLLEASESLKSLADKVDTGEGSLSRLINDPALYDEAKRLVEEVRATVDDIRETSPITTFSSIFFGAF